MKTRHLLKGRALSAALFALLLSVVGATNALAQDFTVGDLNYTVNYYDEASVTVTGHVDGQNAIGSLVIPEAVTYEGTEYSVTGIDSYAFYNCSGLGESLTIPNSVTSIGYNAFQGCQYLDLIYYTGDISQWCNIQFGDDEFLSDGEESNPLVYAGNLFIDNELVTNLVIPETVTEIKRYAFIGAACLTSLTIAASVTSIGDYAFAFCSGLTGSLAIPSSVTSIGSSAFEGCNLTTLNLSNSVTSIGKRAFSYCINMNAVYYEGTIEQWCNIQFGGEEANPLSSAHNLFIDNELVTNLVIPESVTEIKMFAFEGASCLTSLSIHNSVTIINSCAFRYCNGLTGDLTIPNSLTSIGNYAFYGCSGLTGSLTLPNSIIRIGAYAFYLCSGLTGTLSIPNSVTSIYTSTFQFCRGLNTVVIGNSVTSIYYGAFSCCSGLDTLIIGNSVTHIDPEAFSCCSDFEQIVIDEGNTTYDSRNNCNAIIKTSTNELLLGCKNTVIPNSVTSIGNYAFSGCSGLTTVEIPSFVTFIGQRAFNCTGLTSMIIFAETPPTLGSSVFYNVDKSIPVYVPIGTISAYQAALGWSEFTNFIEMCPSEITATANPSEGGSVSGAGTYDFGTIITMTATANEGYAFTNWTENGEVVSTEAEYTFAVTGGRTLVANFIEMTNHYIPQGSAYSETMALYGVIQIDGVEQYSNTFEVGVFCGDECRGSAIASEFSLTHRYLAILNVFGENGHELTFKLYDHSTGQELELNSPAALTFDVDGYGNPIDPYVLNFTSTKVIAASLDPEEAGTVVGAGEYALGETCTLTATANEGFQFKNWTLNCEVVSTEPSYSFTVAEDAAYVAHFHYVHTQALAAGWNWWSTYIEQEGIDGLEMLENSLGGAGVRIQGRDGFVDQFEYQGTSYWYGNLESIENGYMYKVRTNAECEAVMVSDLVSPTDHPVTISEGWNWFGFPCNQSQSLDEAMSGFVPEANDVVKGRNGASTFVSYGSSNMWYGTLHTLEPGQGYMYKSNSSTPKELTFLARRGGEVGEDVREGGFFTPNAADFASNMLVTAVIEMDGEELRSEEYELAAFVGDECRGSVKLMYVEALDRYVAFLLVFGDMQEEMDFALANGNDVVWSDNRLTYAVDGIEGTPTDPVILHFGTLGLDDNQREPVKVFPNPSNGIFNIEGNGFRKVEVLDACGQIVFSKETEDDCVQIDLSAKANGLYLLRVVANNGVTTNRLIKK